MRFLMGLLLAAVLGVGYSQGGLRLGIVTLTPTRMWNAQGEAEYTYFNAGVAPGGVVHVSGTCGVFSGSATLRLNGPDGRQVAGQVCGRGLWSVDLRGTPELGNYRLGVEYQHFSGQLSLSVVH